MRLGGVCHHGAHVIEGCNECVCTAMGMKRDPELVDPDEFGRAMLGRARPCEHGRLRALRACEFCDYDERPPPDPVVHILNAEGYEFRLRLRDLRPLPPYVVIENL